MTESTAPRDPAAAATIEAARDALRRHAWGDAFDLFTRAEAESKDGLSGADLESLAEAAFFAAKADARLGIKERAFKAYQSESDPIRAAYVGRT